MNNKKLLKTLIQSEKDRIELAYKNIASFEKLLSEEAEDDFKSVDVNYEMPTFKSNVEAFKHILSQYPDGLHVNFLVKELKNYNMKSTKNSASGILRRYSQEGEYFEALGGNRFKLIVNN